MKLTYWLFTSIILLSGLVNARADVRLPQIFSDHMLLQRDMAVAVWGWAEPGEKIKVTVADESAVAITDKDGKWIVRLRPLKAGGPHELVVAGKNTVTFKDVLIGDVWICAGQSNMEFGLANADNIDAVLPGATNQWIRFLNARGPSTVEPATDTLNGWTNCTPSNAKTAPAVGYFFAKRIQEETGVPIGLVQVAWGGTAIERWLTPESVRPIPDLVPLLKDTEVRLAQYQTNLLNYLDMAGRWVQESRQALSHGAKLTGPPLAPTEPIAFNAGIGAIYNGRVAPLTPYGIKGVLWYQGESNGGEDDTYFLKMQALINGWRTAWNQGEFPFYFVQIANYQQATDAPSGNEGWAKTRMAQFKALQIPHTGMAVTIDVGAAADIHPRNKEDVGIRLALWALKNDYGQTKLVCSGPLYKGIKIEDNKVRISFDYVGGGLIVGKKEGHGPAKEIPDGQLKKFAIAGENKHWVWADAVIDGSTIVVSSPAVFKPVAVRYGYAMNPDGCNLYNREGLPASPFRTNDW